MPWRTQEGHRPLGVGQTKDTSSSSTAKVKSFTSYNNRETKAIIILVIFLNLAQKTYSNETSDRQLQVNGDTEFQSAKLQSYYGFIEFMYAMVLIVQIASVIWVAASNSNKVYWLTYFSIHMQILGLLGSIKIIQIGGLIQTITTYSGLQSTLFFACSDLNLDYANYSRMDYLDHKVTMLRKMSVSPYILTHRVAPMVFYIVFWAFSWVPYFGIGRFFFRLRILTFLNYMTHFIYFSVTSFAAFSGSSLSFNTPYVNQNIIAALFMIILVLIDACWIVSNKSNYILSTLQRRRVYFDKAKSQLSSLADRPVDKIVQSCDVWYAIAVAFTVGILGEYRGWNVAFFAIFLCLHTLALVKLLVESNTRGTGTTIWQYKAAIGARILAQAFMGFLIIFLAVFQFRDAAQTSAASTSHAEAFATFWLFHLMALIAACVLRCTTMEPSHTKDLYTQVDFASLTRQPASSGTDEPIPLKIAADYKPETNFAPDELERTLTDHTISIPLNSMLKSSIKAHSQERSDFQRGSVFRGGTRNKPQTPGMPGEAVRNNPAEYDSVQDFEFARALKTPQEAGIS